MKNKKIVLGKDGKKEGKRLNKNILLSLIISLIITVSAYFVSKSSIAAIIALVVSIIISQAYFITKELISTSLKIKKMEEVFPDFIELMASNLRAGMTIDKALLYSSRKEFSPLDEEIINLGKEIITGKEISAALISMAKRTKSEKIFKTISVINSGIRSGGNLAVILDETAINMRQRGFIEKRAASNVLMYLIFIFVAVAAGAPSLFALSSVLVEILTSILSDIPPLDASITSSLPITFTSINISVNFVIYFSVIFLIAIGTLASLLLGLVYKGEEKAGLKYILPLILSSISVFFLVRIFLLNQFSDLVG